MPVQLGGEVPSRFGGFVATNLKSVQSPDAASTVGWGSTRYGWSLGHYYYEECTKP